jgi:hypothetical protein
MTARLRHPVLDDAGRGRAFTQMNMLCRNMRGKPVLPGARLAWTERSGSGLDVALFSSLKTVGSLWSPDARNVHSCYLEQKR